MYGRAIIEHVWEDCIKEIIRVGKHVVFVAPNRYSPVDLLKRIVGKGWWSTPGHVRLYGVRELEKYGKVYGDNSGCLNVVFGLGLSLVVFGCFSLD